MAEFVAEKGMKTLLGTLEDDKIIVPSDYIGKLTIKADEGNDVIEVDSNVTSILAGLGDDKLTVNSGTVGTATMGEGNDIVTVSGGLIKTLNLTSGENTVTVNGGFVSTIKGGTGNNTYNLYSNVNKFTGSSGIDNLNMKEVYSQKASLGYGNDIVVINDGGSNNINGGYDDDTFIVTNNSYTTLSGSNGNDSFEITEGYNYTLNGGKDNDSFVLKDVTNSTLKGETGDDSFDLTKSSYITAKAGSGNDSFVVTEGESLKLYGENGDDSFVITGINDSTIDGGNGSDSFLIDGGKNLTIVGGKGSDTYTLKNLAAGSTYLINESAFAKGDVNRLDLSAYNSTDFTYSLDASKNMLLTHYNGMVITLKGWNKHPFEIKFKDTEDYLSANAVNANIEKVINISATKSGAGTAYKDYFVVAEGPKIKASVSKFTEFDVLDLTAFQSGDYTYDVQLVKNTLRLMVNKDGVNVGYVNLTNYLTSASKLQKVLIYDNAIQGGVEYFLTPGEDGSYSLEPATKGVMVGQSGSYEVTPDLEGAMIGKQAATVELTGFTADMVLDVSPCGEKLVAATKKDGNDTVLTIMDAVSGEVISNVTLKDYAGEAKVNFKNQGVVSEVPVGELEAIHGVGPSLDYVVAEGKANGTILGTDKRDKLELQGNVDVVELGEGNDYINIVSGQANNIDLGNGDDVLDIIDGTVSELRLGDGNDTVNASGGTIDKLYGSSGQNTVNITGGAEVTLAGGEVELIKIGNDIPGLNTLTIDNGSVGTLDLGTGDAVIQYNGGTIDKVLGGSGVTEFYIDSDNKVEVDLGDGDDYILVNAGKEHVVAGGAGNDTYEFANLDSKGHYVVDQSTAGKYDQDVIDLTAYNSSDFGYWLEGADLVLNHKEGWDVTISDWKNQATETIQFADKNITTREELFAGLELGKELTASDTIYQLMRSLDDTKLNGFTALSEAIVDCSYGRFNSLEDLVNEFVEACVTNASQDKEEVDAFLNEYCGVIIDNEDTGAITGADAGGPVVKTAESIVAEPEGMTVADFVYNPEQTGTFMDMSNLIKGGFSFNKTFSYVETDDLIFYWDDSMLDSIQVDREICEQTIGGIINGWTKPSFDLIKESYGFDFKDETSTMYNRNNGKGALQIYLDYNEYSTTLAEVRSMTTPNFLENNVTRETREILSVNMAKFGEMLTDVNGNGNSSLYLDRTIAHELTHAAMFANINRCDLLPKFFLEGSAELVHGIDDMRDDTIYSLLNPTLSGTRGDETFDQEGFLREVFDLEHANAVHSTMTYGGGYLLLRYLGKQVADYSVQGGMASLAATSLNDASLSFADDMTAATITPPSWTENEKKDFLVAGNM